MSSAACTVSGLPSVVSVATSNESAARATVMPRPSIPRGNLSTRLSLRPARSPRRRWLLAGHLGHRGDTVGLGELIDVLDGDKALKCLFAGGLRDGVEAGLGGAVLDGLQRDVGPGVDVHQDATLAVADGERACVIRSPPSPAVATSRARPLPRLPGGPVSAQAGPAAANPPKMATTGTTRRRLQSPSVVVCEAAGLWVALMRGELEHDRLLPCDEHAVLEVPLDRAREHRCARCRGRAAPASSTSSRWVDAHDVLLDDRARVELLGDVVGGRADDLHAALARAPVRVGAREGGQERVVDVDHRRAERARGSRR